MLRPGDRAAAALLLLASGLAACHGAALADVTCASNADCPVGATCELTLHRCIDGTPDSMTTCGGESVDPNTDPENCGACGNACPANSTCLNAECTCPPPGSASQIWCTTSCIDPASDTSNCGGCGNVCASGALCSDGQCLCPGTAQSCSAPSPSTAVCIGIDAGTTQAGCLRTLAAGRNQPQQLTVDGTNVYWTESDAVVATPLGGGAAQTLAHGRGGAAIAVDATNLYWSVRDDGDILELPLSGGAVITAASAQLDPESVALDSASIYWSAGQAGLDAVIATPIGGGAPQTLGSGMGSAGRVVFPMGAPGVVWGTSNGVEMLPPGAAIVPLANDPVTDLATDSAYVYWTDAKFGTLARVPVYGGPECVVYSGPASATPTSLATDGTNVYWIDDTTQQLSKLPIDCADGGTPATLASATGSPGGLAVDATSVYWIDTTSGDVMQLTPK